MKIVELFEAALDQDDEDTYWEIVEKIQNNPSPESWEQILRYARSKKQYERSLGVNVLSGLGQTEGDDTESEWATKARIELLNLLACEKTSELMSEICFALAHSKSPTVVSAVARLKDHPDALVRSGVVAVMSKFVSVDTTAYVVSALSDSDPEVRSWAIYGLNENESIDSPDLRKKLAEMIQAEDPADETGSVIIGEALIALASRNDENFVPLIKGLFRTKSVGSLALEAAIIASDPALLSDLEELQTWWDLDPELLEQAIESCSEVSHTTH